MYNIYIYIYIYKLFYYTKFLGILNLLFFVLVFETIFRQSFMLKFRVNVSTLIFSSLNNLEDIS